MKLKYLSAIALVALLGGLATSCSVMKNIDVTRATEALLTGSQALTLSNAEVAQYVKESVVKMDSQNKVAPANSPYTQRLNRLTSGLTAVGNTPLNFKVYLTSDVNAFACADGSVRVYSGLMDLMDDDELLGIIGHEVGHVGLEHSKEAFKQELLNTALLGAIGSTSATAAALTQSELGQLATSWANAKYSRKQENAADDFGYDFLKGAKRNPYAMVKAFEKMQKLEQTAGANSSTASYFQKMFSSHPETSERIKRIEARCKKDGYTR